VTLESLYNDVMQPVFILGYQRSGTTMLRLMLNAHSMISVPFESFILVQMAERIEEYGSLSDKSNRRQLVLDLLTSKGISKWSPAVSLEDIDLEMCNS
jgi:LPS sulfotransferase NodH